MPLYILCQSNAGHAEEEEMKEVHLLSCFIKNRLKQSIYLAVSPQTVTDMAQLQSC